MIPAANEIENSRDENGKVVSLFQVIGHGRKWVTIL